jgi:hypothetical protein
VFLAVDVEVFDGSEEIAHRVLLMHLLSSILANVALVVGVEP